MSQHCREERIIKTYVLSMTTREKRSTCTWVQLSYLNCVSLPRLTFHGTTSLSTLFQACIIFIYFLSIHDLNTLIPHTLKQSPCPLYFNSLPQSLQPPQLTTSPLNIHSNSTFIASIFVLPIYTKENSVCFFLLIYIKIYTHNFIFIFCSQVLN